MLKHKYKQWLSRWGNGATQFRNDEDEDIKKQWRRRNGVCRTNDVVEGGGKHKLLILSAK